MKIEVLAEDLFERAKSCGITIAVAESCTAGALATALAMAPGAGDQFHGGVVSYTKDSKNAVLGVRLNLLRDKTAVCAEVAEAMAVGVLALFPADIAVAITGVAGPEPDEDGNPVGLVYCAAARRGGALHQAVRLDLKNSRRELIIERALQESILLLRKFCVKGQYATSVHGQAATTT